MSADASGGHGGTAAAIAADSEDDGDDLEDVSVEWTPESATAAIRRIGIGGARTSTARQLDTAAVATASATAGNATKRARLSAPADAVNAGSVVPTRARSSLLPFTHTRVQSSRHVRRATDRANRLSLLAALQSAEHAHEKENFDDLLQGIFDGDDGNTEPACFKASQRADKALPQPPPVSPTVHTDRLPASQSAPANTTSSSTMRVSSTNTSTIFSTTSIPITSAKPVRSLANLRSYAERQNVALTTNNKGNIPIPHPQSLSQPHCGAISPATASTATEVVPPAHPATRILSLQHHSNATFVALANAAPSHACRFTHSHSDGRIEQPLPHPPASQQHSQHQPSSPQREPQPPPPPTSLAPHSRFFSDLDDADLLAAVDAFEMSRSQSQSQQLHPAVHIALTHAPLITAADKAMSLSPIRKYASEGANPLTLSPFAPAAARCFRGVVESVSVTDNGAPAHSHSRQREVTVTLTVKDGSSDTRLVRVCGEWAEAPLQSGQIIHVIGMFHRRSGALECTVSDSENLLIIEPDILVSPSTITSGLPCLRRAILAERARGFGASIAATRGSIIHEITENIITNIREHRDNQRPEQERFTQAMERALRKHRTELLAANDTDAKCREHIESMRRAINQFVALFAHPNDSLSPSPYPQTLSVRSVLEVEESIWNPIYGLKGKIDLSVCAAALQPGAAQPLSPSHSRAHSSPYTKRSRLVPVELKTGRVHLHHRAQVLLYTILMAERYGLKVDTGAIVYINNNQSSSPSGSSRRSNSSPIIDIDSNRLLLVPALRSETRSLLARRNLIAAQLSQLSPLTALPGFHSSESDCARCFSQSTCAALFNPERDFSLPSPLARHGLHITAADRAYLQHWLRAVESELSVAEKDRRKLWLESSSDREQRGAAIANLTITKAKKEVTGGVTVTFQRSNSNGQSSSLLECGDRCVLSAECAPISEEVQSVPPTPSSPCLSLASAHFGLSVGTVLDVSDTHVTVQLHNVPLAVRPFLVNDTDTVSSRRSPKQLRARAGKRVFRLDRDEIFSGHRVSIAALIGLVESDESEESAAPSAVRARLRSVIIADTSPTFRGFSNSSHAHLSASSLALLTLLHLPCASPPPLLASLPPQPAPAASRVMTRFPSLSVLQRQCISHCLSASHFALIHGMPGSGKSSTLALLIAMLVALEQRVLVCANTHSAVDHLLAKVQQIDGDIRMARIGAIDSVSAEMQPHRVDPLQYESLEALKARLSSAAVFGVTLMGVGSSLLSRTVFDWCIVDEAALATEPLCLGPLQRAHRFVLCGDPAQLPPLVRSSEAKQLGLERSLFARLAEKFPAAVFALNQQFRMNQSICALAAELAYDGQLHCADSETETQCLAAQADSAQPPHPFLAPVLAPSVSVVWLDTTAVDSRFGAAFDITAVVSSLTTLALVRAQVPASSVAVLSPFHAHLRRLSHMVGALGVALSTIDRFQGREAPCVILSLGRARVVAAADHCSLARLNVAITRARAKLIIVGSAKDLGEKLAQLCQCYRVTANVQADEERASEWLQAAKLNRREALERCSEAATARQLFNW